MSTKKLRIALAAVLCATSACHPQASAQGPSKPVAARPTQINLPGGEAGIGFDDLRYSPTLGRLLVPGGRTGNLDLVDPATGDVTAIGGFGSRATYAGGHGDGTTSVDEGDGLLYAIDRTLLQVMVIDPARAAILSSAPLAAKPDYVRFVPATGELWVTQPDADQIEIFSLNAKHEPTHAALIAVQGGPESLVIDGRRGRAYTHLWEGATVAVDLRTRELVAHWDNGCKGSRGIALDDERGFLFVGCLEGLAVVLDLNHDGRQLASLATGAGVDIIDYDPRRRHLYFPAATSANLSILGVSSDGNLTLLATLPAAEGVHCVTSDGAGHVFVGDPQAGKLLVFEDDFPNS